MNKCALHGLPEGWRGAAGPVLAAWEGTTQASSAVENWHSVLRPHPAVYRVLSRGLLALLAVWRNHRRFEQAEHAGQSPLELSGLEQRTGDWLEVLGYPAAVMPPSRATPGKGLAVPSPRLPSSQSVKVV